MLSLLYQILTSLGYLSPIHPPITHIPIGLVTGALVFGLIARFFSLERMALTARACATLALAFALLTILFGFMDWQHFYLGGWLHPIKMKLILASVLVGLLLLAVILGQGVKYQGSPVLVVYALCFLTVVGLGWFGDKLTYSARIEAFPKQSHPGLILYINNCYSCHPDGGNLIAPELQLGSSEKLSNFPVFLSWIRRPKPPMPSFSPSRLPDEQAQALYQFLIDFVWNPKRPSAKPTGEVAPQPGGNPTQESGQ